MKRTFLTNLALLLVLNLLVKPFYILGIDAGVQDAVGAEGYGVYAALLSLSFLLNIVLDLGITNFNTRHIAQHTHLMGKTLGGLAGMRFALVGGYALLTVGTGLALGYRGEQLSMLGWLVLNQALAATLLYLRSNIAGAQRYRQDSLLSVLDRILLIGVVGWLLWGRAGGGAFRIEWFVWVQTGAYAVATLVALLLVLRLSGPVRLSVRPTFSLVVLRQSFPYALLILLMTLYYRIDTLMLERLLPDGALQAGIYAQGFRFVEALNMLGYLFAGLLLPIFSRMLRAREDVAPLTLLAWRLLLAGSLAVAAFGAFNAGAVLDLRYSEDTTTAAMPFALLLWCFVAVSTTYVFGTLLTAAGDLRLLNRMAAAGALVNIGLNLWLIPLWKAEGAAWASLVTQVGTALLQVVLVLRTRKLPGVGRVVLGALVYAVVLVAAAWWLGGMAWGLGAQVVAFGALALGSAVATGLLDVRSLPQVQALLQRGR